MTVKSRLLEILEKQKGETLSGEKLAEELHCTRAAIWKAVKSLREEGYKIEAGQNKGYMLAKANDRLSVEAIRPFLLSPEVYIGVYQEVDSTNRAAKAASSERRSRTWKLRSGRKSECRTRPTGQDVSIRRRMRESISV